LAIVDLLIADLLMDSLQIDNQSTIDDHQIAHV